MAASFLATKSTTKFKMDSPQLSTKYAWDKTNVQFSTDILPRLSNVIKDRGNVSTKCQQGVTCDLQTMTLPTTFSDDPGASFYTVTHYKVAIRIYAWVGHRNLVTTSEQMLAICWWKKNEIQ